MRALCTSLSGSSSLALEYPFSPISLLLSRLVDDQLFRGLTNAFGPQSSHVRFLILAGIVLYQ